MHPILFQIGSFTVYTYGVFVAIAAGVALVLAERRAGRLGIGRGMAADVLFVLFVSGVIGARLFFVWQHAEDYRNQFWKALWIPEGGLVWYGGFLTAAVAGTAYAVWRKMPVFRLADFFSPITSLAHAIGRIGCFFNGCCYGRMFGSRQAPVQLAESVLLAALSVFLFRRLSKDHPEGSIFIEYVLGYSTIRFFIEFLRGDQTVFYFLTLPQWTSAVLFAAALFFRHSLKSGRPRRPA